MAFLIVQTQRAGSRHLAYIVPEKWAHYDDIEAFIEQGKKDSVVISVSRSDIVQTTTARMGSEYLYLYGINIKKLTGQKKKEIEEQLKLLLQSDIDQLIKETDWDEKVPSAAIFNHPLLDKLAEEFSNLPHKSVSKSTFRFNRKVVMVTIAALVLVPSILFLGPIFSPANEQSRSFLDKFLPPDEPVAKEPIFSIPYRLYPRDENRRNKASDEIARIIEEKNYSEDERHAMNDNANQVLKKLSKGEQDIPLYLVWFWNHGQPIFTSQESSVLLENIIAFRHELSDFLSQSNSDQFGELFLPIISPSEIDYLVKYTQSIQDLSPKCAMSDLLQTLHCLDSIDISSWRKDQEEFKRLRQYLKNRQTWTTRQDRAKAQHLAIVEGEIKNLREEVDAFEEAKKMKEIIIRSGLGSL